MSLRLSVFEKRLGGLFETLSPWPVGRNRVELNNQVVELGAQFCSSAVLRFATSQFLHHLGLIPERIARERIGRRRILPGWTLLGGAERRPRPVVSPWPMSWLWRPD